MQPADPNRHGLFDLQGQRLVVTGAASGIGRAMAQGLLCQGASVLLVDRDAGALEVAWAGSQALHGARAQTAVCDTTDTASFQSLVERFATSQGGIDGLFANAGISGGPGFGTAAGREAGTLRRQSMAQWGEIINTNLCGTATCMQAVLPAMKNQGRGRIVVTASIAGLCAEPFVSYGYAVSKAAVLALVRQSALELGPHGITVNALAPGFIKTRIGNGRLHEADVAQRLVPHIPLGRLGNSEDLLGIAVFLASRASSYITGAVIPVDGGYLLNQKDPAPC